MDDLQQHKDKLKKLMNNDSVLDNLKIDDIINDIYHAGRMKGITEISLEINQIVCRNLKANDLVNQG